MSGPDFTIPEDRLPEGFARAVDRPPERPAEPRPAATIVLLRDGDRGGLEVLLLRRVRSAGFVPGAWVFPGGRVDLDDATPALVERLEGLSREQAAARLGLEPDAEPPGVAYWVAALREAFEETGILVGRDADGRPAPSIADRPEVRALRDELLEDEDRFPSILDRMGCRMDGAAMEYVAHWITPVAEPRRYDTRFFAAAVAREQEVALAEAELTDHAWLTPDEALSRREEGSLPMVFPTIRTLEGLRGFSTPMEALRAYRARAIPTILPRLVRTPTGIGIEVD
ncbi:MAG: NUDIX domain-containing protein [Gemmatimonadetes bacterium]|nr:NUDIX domain-containing protein [Gemmatimonadota bacterium]